VRGAAVLELLNHANGFVGAPNLDSISDQPLAAPQATADLDPGQGRDRRRPELEPAGLRRAESAWLVIVAINFVLKKSAPAATACRRWAWAWPSTCRARSPRRSWSARWPATCTTARSTKTGGDTAKRLGVLVMSGFIVGESLFNVALAGLIVVSGKGEPLAIANSLSEPQTMVIALIVGVSLVWSLYRWFFVLSELSQLLPPTGL
jgi:hypothetical protein